MAGVVCLERGVRMGAGVGEMLLRELVEIRVVGLSRDI